MPPRRFTPAELAACTCPPMSSIFDGAVSAFAADCPTHGITESPGRGVGQEVTTACASSEERYDTPRPGDSPTRRWRSDVEWFADAMEAKLKANDHKGGWDADEPVELLRRLREETAELAKLVKPTGGISLVMLDDPERVAILAEAADVANFAMFIAELCAKGMVLK